MLLFSKPLSRFPPSLMRAASTQTGPKGLAAVLQKNRDDVVITFAKRTAMGRAKKGQLKDTPVDELLHALFKVLFYLHQHACMAVTVFPGSP